MKILLFLFSFTFLFSSTSEEIDTYYNFFWYFIIFIGFFIALYLDSKTYENGDVK